MSRASVEGSSDGVQNSLLPRELIVKHDFSRGAWWPRETFDAVWCVEFVEHVGRQYVRSRRASNPLRAQQPAEEAARGTV